MLNRRVLRVRVLQYLYSYYSLVKFSDKPEQLKPDFIRNLSASLEEINKYYYKFLSLPIILSDINAEKKEIAKSEKIKKSPSMFTVYRTVRNVYDNEKLQDAFSLWYSIPNFTLDQYY
jgi:predicted transcriptional regulator with HTH domain